ncbi:DUF4123 domain-containing protein [Marinobacter sp. R17]|uniref:DUF4123 domain-containing protein n=1 Tax=Marinobacter sp. R17 TaxID=2484250 RepID=UPI000F4C67CC|nr:DUF4123 domain-containing protein [Marinobacter sp. R17]ROT99739.1 DUF4123 domain-containing protein [Marinobacter sp. R17]
MTIHESLKVPQTPLERADFAILDLAQDDTLLTWFYETTATTSLDWSPLYAETVHEESWQVGPILIQCRGHEGFIKAFQGRAQRQPIGVLVKAGDADLTTLTEQLRMNLTIHVANGDALFRFYDPRSLDALFQVLEEHQIVHLMGSSQQWFWFNDGGWQMQLLPNGVQRPEQDQRAPPVISEGQLRELEVRKRDRVAEGLHTHYRDYIPASDSLGFVKTQVRVAAANGIERYRDLERWIRMAIAAKGPLEQSEGWERLQKTGLDAKDILNQLEHESA